jgi:tetratricopeptide (TPR) repeat protein
MKWSLSNSARTLTIAGLFAVCAGTTVWSAANDLEARQWLYKAIDAYDREDYGAAKTDVAMALQSQPNFAEAYLLKGMLEHHDGQPDKADASWKRAMDLNPRLPDDMRKSLEKKAHAIESHLSTQEFEHFSIQFNGAEERDKAWLAVKHLDEAYNHLGSRFDIFPETHFSVIIFTSDEFWEAWNAPGWLGGFFDKQDGRIRVRMDTPPGGDEEYRRRLRHEFTHAFIHELYPKDLPGWFQEGAAQFYAYASNSGFWKDTRFEELRKELKNAPWITLDQVERAIRKKEGGPGHIYLAYLEAEALMLAIAKDRGESWIPSVVDKLRKGAAFDDAFQEVVGRTPADRLDQLKHSWE